MFHLSSSTKRIILNSLKLIQKDQENPESFPWHRLPPIRIFQYLNIIIFSVRCLILAYTLKYPDLYEPYIALDPPMAWVARFASMQPLIVLSIPVALQLILYVDYLFFVQKNYKFWFYVYELIIVNGIQFWELNNIPPFDWRLPWKSALERKNWFARTWNGENQVQFSRVNLRMYPYIARRERARAFLVSSIWEHIDWAYSVVLGKLLFLLNCILFNFDNNLRIKALTFRIKSY